MENEVLDYVMNTPGNTNPAILGQMLDENSGTKLPEPTPEDNGKVLGVADGAYALVSGGGGGGSNEPLILNGTEAGIDASYNEIKTAVLEGKTVWLYLVLEGDTIYIPLIKISHITNPTEKYNAWFMNTSISSYEFSAIQVSSSDPDEDLGFSEG